VLGALGGEAAQLMDLAGEAVACLLEAAQVQQARARARREHRRRRRYEGEARGHDLRQLTLKARDLRLEGAPRRQLRGGCGRGVADLRRPRALAGA